MKFIQITTVLTAILSMQLSTGTAAAAQDSGIQSKFNMNGSIIYNIIVYVQSINFVQNFYINIIHASLIQLFQYDCMTVEYFMSC